MRSRIVFIAGTDTGVGKTVLTSLLARFLLERDFAVAALKPICSGGRNDARLLHAALNGAMPLEEINPWSFRAPLAPGLAARQERRRLRAAEVLAHLRKVRREFDIVLIEGAGGLLSPLGEDFDARDLIIALRAIPVIVCPNRLGALNQARLVISALPAATARKAQVVLVSPRRADLACRANPRMLAEFWGARRVCVFPWLRRTRPAEVALRDRRARQALEVLAQRLVHHKGP
jgi:dethiobiotin synthetase